MSSALIGTWCWNGHQDCGYFFAPEGKGSYIFCGGEKPFEYIDNGDSVTVHFTGDLLPNLFRYNIAGDRLSIEDSFGGVVIYNRCESLIKIQIP